jgi:general secretion pathway protein H
LTVRHIGLASLRSGNAARGFTLLEMLLVLTIAVIAMALVVPNFSKGLDSVRLQSASREIASSLRYLRGHAVSKNKQAEFNIDVKNNVYRITGRNKTYSIPKAIGIRLITADTEISDENQGTIRFYPDGSSTGGRVTLEAGNRKRLVDVNWLTGHVEILAEVEE